MPQTSGNMQQVPIVVPCIPVVVPANYCGPLAIGLARGMFTSVVQARQRKVYHKRRPAHVDKNSLYCHFCGKRSTPEWRKGPAGPATLCNACGLQWAKKQRALSRAAADSNVCVAIATAAADSTSSPAPNNSTSSAASTTAVVTPA